MSTKSLKQKNEEFNALPPIEKRLAICHEVLMTIQSEKFVPGQGYGGKYRPYTDDFLCLPSGDLQEHVLQGLVCQGCAKAAIIVAQARLGDNIRISADGDLYGQTVRLAHGVSGEIFGRTCADIIEALYEGYGANVVHDTDSYYKLLKSLPEKAKPRMIAIYQHIIDNGGYLVIGNEKY